MAVKIKGETIMLKRKNPLSSVEFRSLEIRFITFPILASFIENELKRLIFLYMTLTKTSFTRQNMFCPIAHDPCLNVVEISIENIATPPQIKAFC